MIEIIILLPITILILNIRLWLFENIFYINKTRYIIWIMTIIMWIISWLSIVMYPTILNIFSFENLAFTNTNNINNFSVFASFWLYLSIITLITKVILWWFKFSKFFITNFILFSIAFLAFWYFWLNTFTDKLLIYYIFVAFWEEFIKYLVWLNFFKKWKISNNDIILFSMLSAIWFAFIENIVYMVWIMAWEEFITAIIWWFTILVARWIIWFLAHIIFTWTIWYWSYKWLNTKKIIKFSIIWILFWTIAHYMYDILLYKNIWIVVPFIIIWWYLWISFLMNSSDRLYIKWKNLIQN